MANFNVNGDISAQNLSGYTPDKAGIKIKANDVTGQNYLTFTNADGNTTWGYFSVDSSGNLVWSGSISETQIAGGGLTLATAKAWNWNGLTTNASLDFTNIPSWVKRITVIMSDISAVTGAANAFGVQIGSGSYVTSGYKSGSASFGSGAIGNAQSTTSFAFQQGAGEVGQTMCGHFVLTNVSGNTWVGCGSIIRTNAGGGGCTTTGQITLSGTLDRVRVITVTAGDAFDAGTINIMYEG